MSRKQLQFLGFMLLALMLVLAACGDDDKKDEATPETTVNPDWRLGLITNVGGTISDGGFSESAHLGATRAVEEFKLDYAYSQSIDENDYEIQLDKHIAEGRNILITVGFNMEEITYQYAVAHPDVVFIGVDQGYSDKEDIPENLIGLQFAEDEAAFMVGTLAGLMTESNTVAVIGGMEIPPVVRLAEGFRNGVNYVNPDAEVLIEYTGVFDDQEKGTATAQEFMEQGADVIFGAAGFTGYAGIQYAAREGVWVIGVDQDEWRTNFRAGEQEGSERILTSAIKRVDSGVYQAVASIVTGNRRSGIFLLDTASCGVGYAPFHEAEASIPEEGAQMLEAVWRALAAGTLDTGIGEDATRPDSLSPGERPDVPDDAPQPGACEG
ncbi:MAG: BMP family ABC transporter substrate-binding protein [Anaerolineae bacterium]|nr:BMP family ABC transporter substrate-binding protein [Anaerolineae bacterium]